MSFHSFRVMSIALGFLVAAGCGGGGGGGGTGPTPPPVPAPMTTSLNLTSDPGDFVGDGKSYSYTQANAIFNVTAQGGLLSVEVLGNQTWRGAFQMPAGYSSLATGTYNNLTVYPVHDPVIGGLRWVNNGRGCGGVIGSVTIRKVTYEADTLTELDLQFTQYCDGTSFALRGELRWNAKDPTTPPGPTAPPAGLWQPPSGVTPANGTYVYLESQPDDYVGGGGTYLYTQTTALIAVDASNGNVRVHIAGDEFWHGTFQAMSTLSQLKPGYYGNLLVYPGNNPAVGGIDWIAENRACGQGVGWFVVDSLTFSGSTVTAADIRFEQRCVGRTGVLRGKVHWDSSDTSQAPGPTAPPPGLWQPAAGVTPATGNYVYFEMPTGNFADSGKTFLYTQANSILTVRTHDPGVAIDIHADKSWVADFQAMSYLAVLQVGYYGNLQQYPWHNPTVGGTSFSSNLTLICSRGWFVVDAVNYEGFTLKSLDLRFELNCGGPTALLRGKVHWTDSDPTVPPGPTAPPTGLWHPEPGSTPASGNYVYLDSEPGAFVGGGQKYLYTPDNAQILIDALGAAMLMHVIGDKTWIGTFEGMNSLTQFEPGYYGDLHAPPNNNPATGALSWVGGSAACSSSTGWFVVDAATYSGSTLTSIDLRFEQRCTGFTAALHGAIHWSQ